MEPPAIVKPKVWLPSLRGKQWRIYNLGTQQNSERRDRPDVPYCALITGSRRSLKTYGTLHRVMRHLWQTPGAQVGMFAKYMKTLTDYGSFVDLITHVAPEWMRGGRADCPKELLNPIGMRFLTKNAQGQPGPITDSKTRTIYFRVNNAHGGVSELRLFSLNNDTNAEIEARMRNTTFSMIYFSELTNFTNPTVVLASLWQLRMGHLRPWQHMFIADTNPSPEGPDCWIYKMFFERKIMGEDAPPEMRMFIDNLTVLELFFRENPLLTDSEKAFFEAAARADMDPGTFDRDVLGLWTRGYGTKGKHFADLWKPSVHVIGGGAEESGGIEVSPNSDELFTGWDLGASVNHAAVIAEKRVHILKDRSLSYWCIHDELVSVGEKMQIDEFALKFLEKMRALEAAAGRKLVWRHISDDSALVVQRASGAGTDALEVQIATNGEIILLPVLKAKGQDMVPVRVKMIRRLLRENRIFVADRCEQVKAMFMHLRHGRSEKEFVAWDEYKHIFDALSYIIFEIGYEDLRELAYRPSSTPVADAMISL